MRSYIKNEDAYIALLTAVKRREPFSILRLGDGEGIVLRFPDVSRELIDFITTMWFGDHEVTDAEVLDIRDHLIAGVAEASMVGLPTYDQITSSKAAQWRLVHEYIDAKPEFAAITPVSHMLHIWMHDEMLLDELISLAPAVTLLTCRSLSPRFEETFKVETPRTILIPEEAHYSKDKPNLKRHYPDRYLQITQGDELTPRVQGELFLVGGGVLGKVYCSEIKRRGGVAIDIGSVFDMWGYIGARGSVKQARRGM